MNWFVIIHDVRSSENVGSIFRTADAAGVSKIFITGYTPGPLDRFGRKNEKLAKAALGAESSVPSEHTSIEAAMSALKQEGVTIVAVEQSPNAIPYEQFSPKNSTAFIFGNEVSGLPELVLSLSDIVIEIPMRGMKESLNVSVAAGIILYRYS